MSHQRQFTASGLEVAFIISALATQLELHSADRSRLTPHDIDTIDLLLDRAISCLRGPIDVDVAARLAQIRRRAGL